MPTNTDRNGESSLAAAVELTAELTDNTCFKMNKDSIHFFLTNYKDKVKVYANENVDRLFTLQCRFTCWTV